MHNEPSTDAGPDNELASIASESKAEERLEEMQKDITEREAALAKDISSFDADQKAFSASAAKLNKLSVEEGELVAFKHYNTIYKMRLARIQELEGSILWALCSPVYRRPKLDADGVYPLNIPDLMPGEFQWVARFVNGNFPTKLTEDQAFSARQANEVLGLGVQMEIDIRKSLARYRAEVNPSTSITDAQLICVMSIIRIANVSTISCIRTIHDKYHSPIMAAQLTDVICPAWNAAKASGRPFDFSIAVHNSLLTLSELAFDLVSPLSRNDLESQAGRNRVLKMIFKTISQLTRAQELLLTTDNEIIATAIDSVLFNL